jgi:hypothetical protein
VNVAKRKFRALKEREKADALFAMYYGMGPDRSLEKLRDVCAAVGLKLALSTYKRYSMKYDWQRRLMELTVKEREAKQADALAQIEKMNEFHIRVHRGLMGLAIAGINYYQSQIEKQKVVGIPQTLRMDIADIVKLVHQAQIGERLARGQATSRSEIMVELIDTFIQEFALIFREVNRHPSEQQREVEWIKLCDDMIQRFYSQTVKQGVGMLARETAPFE